MIIPLDYSKDDLLSKTWQDGETAQTNIDGIA
jgi:hypothetical protein